MKPKEDWRRCDCGSGQIYFNKKEVVCRACGARYPRDEFEKRRPPQPVVPTDDEDEPEDPGQVCPCPQPCPLTPIGGEDVQIV